MKRNFTDWLYFLLFFFIGYFIYKFQIEKSFSLLSIYILCVTFSFISFVLKADSRKALPVLFISALFVMYGINNEDGTYQIQLEQFLLLLFTFFIVLAILLSKYSLKYKKIAITIIACILACIYIISGDKLSEYNYIPFLLGSFFMFRTISFLHEIKFLKKEIKLIDNINYFLLTPNFSMPLFPIVDYKSFVTSYEGINSNTLKRGALFICRGMFQMILYRYIYHEIIIPFDQIHTASQALIFLVANFMIVLRVIGAFHIAIGLVIITGYNIPDLFNNIFFATGFSDLWRRINIYWREFIMKVYFYPIYFKLKKSGTYPALFISTILCFLITWILHTYQWFWIKGAFPVEIKDMIFWGIFGLLVAINTLYQQKKLDDGVRKKENSFTYIKQAISGLIVLLIMSFLWSIWTSNSYTDWITIINGFKNIDLQQSKIISALFGFYILIATCYHYYEKKKVTEFGFLKRNMKLISFGSFIIFFLILETLNILTLNQRSIFYRMRLVPIITEHLNKQDLRMIDNGYYTNLISTNNYCSQVWINDNDIARNWTKYITAKTTEASFDQMLTKNIPNSAIKFKGVNYTVNSAGLRDIEYSKIKPDSCYRIIVLGGSYECGNGITDGEDFLSLVESRINNEYSAIRNGKKVHIELINFSSNGYHMLQRLYQYKDNARYWNADAVFLFIHTKYRIRISKYVARLIHQGYKITDPYLLHIIKVTNISKDDPDMVLRDKLGSYADSLNFYAANEINKIANEDKTNLIAIFLPTAPQISLKRDSMFMSDICKQNDLKSIYLSDVFIGQELKDITLSDVDNHPSQKASELIAHKLLTNIISHQDYFNIQFTKK